MGVTSNTGKVYGDLPGALSGPLTYWEFSRNWPLGRPLVRLQIPRDFPGTPEANAICSAKTDRIYISSAFETADFRNLKNFIFLLFFCVNRGQKVS